MGRPAVAADEKRKQVAVRLDPAARKRLEKLASQRGSSVGAEVERLALIQLARSENLDEQTLEFISQVEAEITEIQNGLGNPWHEHLETWAAVAHMLRTGPVMLRRPSSPSDDDEVQEAYDKMTLLQKERSELVAQAARVGIAWIDELPKKLGGRGPMGLFGGPSSGSIRQVGLLDMLAGDFTDKISPRSMEANTLAHLDDGEEKTQLFAMHERVVALDAEIEAATEEWVSQLRLYWDAEAEGRNWNRTRQKEKAAKAAAAGAPTDYYQLNGIDPWL